MWYNSIMAAVLRSPLHGMLSKNMMLITVTGKKTGRQYTTPVSYSQQGEVLWVISNRERTWWRNLSGGAPVRLVFKGKTINAYGEAVTDDAQVEEQLDEYISHFPRSARALGVETAEGRLDQQSLKASARTKVFVRIQQS
jgi:deazaflavin-dependent oxidoreductase (nitroreductase family)